MNCAMSVLMLAKVIVESERQQQMLDNGLQMFFVAAGVMGALLLVFWIIVQISRKRTQDAVGSMTVSFTLNDLRDMKEAGQLTDQEYDRAKQKIIGRTRKTLLGDDEPSDVADTQGLEADGDSDSSKSDPSGESD
jgi:hypothetical protein